MTATAKKRTPPLSAERITKTALRLVDRRGLDALSMRNVGAAVGVEAMSLYHYFPNRDALLDSMVDLIFSELNDRVVPQESLTDLLREIGASYRDVLRTHRNFVTVLAVRPPIGIAALTGFEKVLRALTDHGLDVPTAAHSFSCMAAFVVGYVCAEVGVAPIGADISMEQRTAALLSLPPDRFPLVIDLAKGGRGDPEEQFLYGLNAIIAGLLHVAA